MSQKRKRKCFLFFAYLQMDMLYVIIIIITKIISCIKEVNNDSNRTSYWSICGDKVSAELSAKGKKKYNHMEYYIKGYIYIIQYVFLCF